MMKYINSPLVRMSFGLVMVTLSALLMSDMLGMVPDTRRAELHSRKIITESLAVQFSMLIPNEQIIGIEETLKFLVGRNDEVLSAGVRREKGELFAQFGGHDEGWTLQSGESSTPTQIQVPLYNNKVLWGTVEIRFTDLASSSGSIIGGNSFLGVIFLVGALCFVGYMMFLKRTLRELDPSAVIPERVRLALDTLAEGLLIVDQDNVIVFSNDAFARRTGLTPDDLVGRASESLPWEIDEQDSGHGQLPWVQVLEGGELSTDDNATVKLSSGLDKVFKFALNATPITTGEGDIRGALITFDDVTEVEKQNEDLQRALGKLELTQVEITRQNQELHVLATRDPLTGLLNRRSFFDTFETMITEAKQANGQLACMVADIDFFKLVNDNFGHSVGDIVIKLLATVLSDYSRPNDIVGRFGGEEFCIALPGANKDEAFKIADRIRLVVQGTVFAEFKGDHSITVSIGVTDLSEGGKNVAEMFDQGDRALYVAKESGRNQVVCWPVDAELDRDGPGEHTTGELGVADVSVVSDVLDVSDVTDVVDVSEVADVADVSEVSEVSEIADEPDVSDVPEVTDEIAPEEQDEVVAMIPELSPIHEIEIASESAESAELEVVQTQELPNDAGSQDAAALPNQNSQQAVNRSLLIDRINQAILRSARYKTKMAVLAVEFDVMQRVNEALGFAVGAKLEQEVTQRLKDVLRSTDTVSISGDEELLFSVLHTGGREIVLLLTDLDDTDTIPIILKRLFSAGAEPILADGIEFYLDADVGVSIYPLDSEDGDSLLSYANSAMREAKKGLGKNNWQFYSADINDTSKRKLRLEADLHTALERGELVAFYQPKTCLKSGTILGMEALLRWKHPQLGMVPPDEFIALAEQSDLIDKITSRLITTTCQQIETWQDAGYGDVSIAVNLSPVSFRNPKLADQIISLVSEHEIPAGTLEFEITETVVVQNMQVAIDILDQLSNAGFCIAIDDFGVGYSSFSYLKKFPVNKVKIDKSFVSDLGKGPTDAAIISAMIAMAHSLGLTVVAEGVETEEELHFLQDLHCDQVQGYLLSRPIPADEVSKLLSDASAIKRMILKHVQNSTESASQKGATSMFGIINEFSAANVAPLKLVSPSESKEA